MARSVARARHDLPVGVFHAVVADEIHDAAAALLPHERQHVLQAAHVAHELELQALLPRLLAQRLEHAAGRGARVVDEDVDAAELALRAVHELPGIGLARQVRRDGEHLAAARALDLLRGLLQRLVAPRADRHVAALARECRRDALADAFAPAGDAGDLALELQIHDRPPLCCQKYPPPRG